MYKWACQMNFLTTYFAPTTDQLVNLAAVLLLGLAFSVIGAAVSGRQRFAPADILVGWAITAFIFTLLGTLTTISFSSITVLMGLLALTCGVYVWKRDRRLLPDGAGKILLMNALLFLIISAMSPSQWDEYSHWLLAARYLFEVDGFPRTGLPVPVADMPGYPNGASLILYLVSRITGSFSENAAPLFHILLLVSMALAAVDLIRRGTNRDTRAPISWRLCALGFMTVTIFSTAFVQKVVFTAYADLPVAACVAFAGLFGWLVLQALSENESATAKSRALQLGLVIMILMSLKPTSLVLMVGVMGGITITALRDPNIRFISYLKLVPVMVIPGIVIMLLWNGYTAIHMPSGTPSVMPFERWQWHQMPQTLATIGTIMTKKGAYFGMMLTLSTLSLIALVRFRSEFDRFVLIAGCTFVGYNLFLVFVYLAIFGGYSGSNALSYWRYNMHIAHLGVFCSAYGLSVLWHNKLSTRMSSALPKLGQVAIIFLILLPLLFATKLRFDIRAPKQFIRMVGTELSMTLPKGSRVFVIDPRSAGFYAKQMRYELYGAATFVGDTNSFSKYTPEDLRQRLNKVEATHVLIHTHTERAEETLRQKLNQGNAHLLKKSADQWQLIKSWPYPGYNLPGDIKD